MNMCCVRALGKMAGKFLFAAILVVLAAAGAHAQTFRGTILGTVTDPSGAAVAGAKVVVRNLDTGQTREITTTDAGGYTAPELPIGNYSVTVEKAGFQTAVITGIRVEVATEHRADVALRPGQVETKIEVSADTLPQVETTGNTLGGIMESRVVTNLPVNGRDYTKLIYQVPGIAGSPDQITDSPGSFGVFSLNGARGRSNNFLLDGTDMNDGYRNDPSINEAGVFGTPATILPIEAVAELRVLSNFEAEYGRSAGAVINIVTKSGANSWHGSGLEFFRNNELDARNYFNFKPDRQSPFHNNQFGGSLGGPVVRDKTFFFVDYEGLRERVGLNSLARVPTPAEIAAATADIGGTVNPVIAALLKRNPWPGSNINSGAVLFDPSNNASLTTRSSNRVDSMIAKVDHNFSANHMLTGRYYFGDSDQSFPLALVGGGLLPGFNTATPTRVQLVSISYVSVLSQGIVNEARVGWNRFVEGFFPQDRSFDPKSIGLNTGAGPADFGLPKISVGAFAPLGADNGDPRARVDTNWHFIDNVSWKLNRHDVKFGFEFRRTSISQILDRTFRGKLSFSPSGPPSGAGPLCGNLSASASASLCDALEQFLQGVPTGGTQAQGNTNRNTYENSFAWYVQDSWHWSSRLTFNLGLRWDYYGLIKEKKDLFTNVNPVNGTLFAVGGGDLYEPDYNNFGPRVSVAWDVTGKGKTVLRAGYGLFYDAFSQDFFIGHLPFNSSFAPGPAYAGIGPAKISFAGIATDSVGNPLPLSSSQPAFTAPAPIGDAFGVDRNIRTPYSHNFNLNLQQEVTKNIMVQVGYVGSQSRKLFRFRDINQPTQAQITAADLACNCINVGGVPRRLNQNLFYINFEETSSSSNYNALQTSVRVRNWHGLESTLNFVWSHSIDDASDGEDFVPNAAQPNDSNRPGLEKGNSNFDIRRRMVWNFIYQFPNRKGDWKRLTDGWGINGVVTLQSGQPFHLNYNFEDDFDGSGEFFGRPDVVGPLKFNPRDPNNFLDLSSFKIPCSYPASGGDGFADTCIPGTRHFGNLGRNSLRGPNFRQVDFSVFKNTAITEQLKVEFRAEFYNLFNRPNFANPYLPIFIADAAPHGIGPDGRSLNAVLSNGRPSGLVLPATGDVGIGYPFLGGGGPRGIQLAVKFTF